MEKSQRGASRRRLKSIRTTLQWFGRTWKSINDVTPLRKSPTFPPVITLGIDCGTQSTKILALDTATVEPRRDFDYAAALKKQGGLTRALFQS